jgi:antagonist of KipI
VPLWKPIYVKGGSILKFGRPKKGCRAYLAIAGGIDVPVVMNSRSTYVRGSIGGFLGRMLQKDDMFSQKPTISNQTKNLKEFLSRQIDSYPFQTVKWTITAKLTSIYKKNPEIRFIKGPHFDHLTEKSKDNFLTEQYKVTTNSDRMGYRLQATSLQLSKPIELLSEAVTMGTIQVPNDGQPIILMADRQTIGGYPKIGYVASIDMPVLAQVLPGEKLTFTEISIEVAQKLLLKREQTLSEIKIGILLVLRRILHGSN